ncbi:hypothetical protein L1280_000803 [Deinococcus sp. HSC-46F16]|uniref:hypothetical protein n=1 Tax=Deinococcus sp. HSC-46F16 TaxID=2910968 RepID=UPI0020A02B37|nr:hypothetical protein [Deinococcus sp. HSC-46F16]MCP2013675.1 hypothetical protein [Deinococcus sp. HSC-46F16]
MRKPNRPTLFALAAVSLTAGLVLAASGGTSQAPSTQAPQRVQPTQPGQAQPGTGQTQPSQNQAPSSGTNYADVFLQKLAAALGVTVERLKAAALSAGSATVDQAVGAGDLSAEQAAQIKERMQNDPLRFGFGRGGFGRGDHEHGPGGRGFGRDFGHHGGERGSFGGQDQGSAPVQEEVGAAEMGT